MINVLTPHHPSCLISSENNIFFPFILWDFSFLCRISIRGNNYLVLEKGRCLFRRWGGLRKILKIFWSEQANSLVSQSVTQADYLSIYSEMDVNKSLTITKSGINHVANKSFQEIMQSQEELLSLKSVYEIFTCCVGFDCGSQVSMGYKQKYSYIVCVYRIETTWQHVNT